MHTKYQHTRLPGSGIFKVTDSIDTLLATWQYPENVFSQRTQLIDLGPCLVVFLEEDIHPYQCNFSI